MQLTDSTPYCQTTAGDAPLTVIYGPAPGGRLLFASAVADPSALLASPADVAAFLRTDAPASPDRAWALAA